MPDKACCTTWIELAPELKEAKINELEAIRNESNLPKSMFALLYKTLDGMCLHCPCCGASLSTDAPLTLRTEKPAVDAVPQKKLVKYKCGKCDGRGRISKVGDPDVINCMACLGEGIITKGQNTTTDGGDLSVSGVLKGPDA